MKRPKRKRKPQPAAPRSRSPLAGRKFPAEPLTQTEVLALLKACSNRAPTGIRNRALIATLYRAGLRVGEATALLPRDFDAAAGTLLVRHGKGDRSRRVGIDPEAAAMLSRWLDKRDSLGWNGRHPLFCTLQGRPVQTVYVRNLLKRLAKKVGIDKRVHPHGLRHSFAFEAANEGMPVHVLQQCMGHSSLATTDRYVRHLNPRAAIDAMQQRSWPQ